jgi:hypothetical protein
MNMDTARIERSAFPWEPRKGAREQTGPGMQSLELVCLLSGHFAASVPAADALVYLSNLPRLPPHSSWRRNQPHDTRHCPGASDKASDQR